jgi:Ca2+-binding RTX toxin-like protein
LVAARTIYALAAACVALVAVPAGALAGTAELRTGSGKQRLVYVAGAGEQNQLVVAYDGRSREYLVLDSVGVTPGAGCSLVDPADPTRAVCPVTARLGTSGVAARLGDGDDEAAAVGARARLEGDEGDDALVGSNGDDVLDGGPGADGVAGRRGNDRLLARDDAIDVVVCGTGRDRATLDGLDFYADRCERADRSEPGGATLLEMVPGRGDRLLLTVGCPRDARPSCVGRVSARESGESLGSAGFGLRPASAGSYSFDLPADAARRLREGGLVTVTVAVRSRSGRLRRTVTFTGTLSGPD